MTNEIIDTHAHLDMPQFNGDREVVIKRAVEAGVTRIITDGTDLESSKKAVELAERHSAVYATAGFHPQEAGKMRPGDINEISELAKRPRTVAIGEIGLDFYRERAPRQVQIQVLKTHLEIAGRLNLPVIIHSRQADQNMPVILKEWVLSLSNQRKNVGVIHCFNGDTAIAKTYLDLGFYISLGAYIGYPSSRMSEIIKHLPTDRLLIETDSPYLPPQTHRGKRNEPAYLPMTLAALSRITGLPAEKLAKQTSENALRLFQKIN